MILVTGASGFLGQHLITSLTSKGKKVRALYYNHPPKDHLLHLPNVTWMQCNLLDIFEVEDAMNDIEEVYHCAAIVSFETADKDYILHFNVEATANIVNEALERNIRKMVHVSSIASLGRSEGEKPITEAEEWEESKYNSLYSQSKYLAETEVWRGIGEGLNAVIINPAIILGEGNWNEGSARLMKVVHGEFPFYTKGVNGWVDVTDVVKAMIMLMESEINNERFIVSAGNYTYQDIFTKMARALGKKPPQIPAGKLLSGLVWRWNAVKKLLWGAKSSVTKETSVTAQKRSYYNNEKLLKSLPGFYYQPIDYTINRMAERFLKDYAKNQKKILDN